MKYTRFKANLYLKYASFISSLKDIYYRTKRIFQRKLYILNDFLEETHVKLRFNDYYYPQGKEYILKAYKKLKERLKIIIDSIFF
jgi:hypothetical protein